MKLILASTSRYRRELLERLHVSFDAIPPGIDETAHPNERPGPLSLRLSIEKAAAVSEAHPDAVVIGSDQTASIDGLQSIGKPGTHERAVAQLRAASGQALVFHTSMAVMRTRDRFQRTITVDTRIRFRVLTEQEIEAYLQAEKPYDCAGAAKCEGLGISLLDSIESSDPTAIIGLPLIALAGQLREAGVLIPGTLADHR
jgi:septum formation protein